MSYNEPRFIEGCRLFNIFPGEEQLLSLRTYAEELALWNSRVALVGPRVLSSLELHFLDSLAPLPGIRSQLPPAGGSLVDVGSGSGLPGVVLAGFLPETSVTLLERSAKKAAFLRNVIALSGLSNAAVKEGDLKMEKALYHGVVCKAFSALPDFIFQALRITAPGGSVFAYKGRAEKAREEVAKISKAGKGKKERTHNKRTPFTAELIPLKVPFLEEERTLVMIKKPLQS